MKFIIQNILITLLVTAFLGLNTGYLLANELTLTPEVITELAAEVAIATGRTFREVPTIEIVTDAELQDIYYAEQDQLDAIYQEKGVTNFYRSWVTGIILGKYSWLSGKIYLVKENIERHSALLEIDRETMETIVLVHELVHALDDQSYDLKDTLSKALSQENSIAISAMLEGHAMYYSELVYEKLALDEDAVESLWRLDSRQYNFLGLLYTKGLNFIKHVFSHSMLSGTELFRHPPLETSMILEPEKYLENEGLEKILLSTVFDQTLLNNFPLQFRYANQQSIDKLTMLMGLNALGAEESLLTGYESGYTYQLYEVVEKKPESYFPLLITDFMEWEKGFLIITISQFDTAENAQNFWEYCREHNQLQWETSEEASSAAAQQFEKPLAGYDQIFFNLKQSTELGTLIYLLPILNSRYVVEMVAINIPDAEAVLPQITAAIEMRIQ